MLSALPLASAAAGYSDLDGHWAQQQVEAFSDLGIVQGYDGKFRPNDSITRGEMAIILDRIMDYQVTARNSFSDLGSAYYTDAVLKANAAGIMLGDGVQVRPTAPITRQEAASMLCRALGLEGGGSLTQFNDRDQVASWAADAVGAMAARGYISGSNGAFRPTASITRAEVVSILSRAVSRLVSANETVTGNVSGDVVVRGAGATLSNMTISGDLIIAEGVAEGDVKLDNVTVSGRTIIRGGGEHSIRMNNVRANGGIVVNKLSGRVRIVTTGSCNVSRALLQTAAILEGNGFQIVEISADMAAGQIVELNGNIGRLVNHSAQVSIQAEGRIGILEASVVTNITGTVRVGSVAQGSSTVTVNSKPVTTTPSTGTSTGGSSSGGGSYQPDPTYRIALDTTAISLQVNQSRTLQATVTVPEGTNNQVYWVSSDTSVVTVGKTTGQVTAVATGTATVTASLADIPSVTAACRVTVTAVDTPVTPVDPINPGWNAATNVDSRFAEGYPTCTSAPSTNGNGTTVSAKVKVPTASADNPVDVYMIVEYFYTGRPAPAVQSVIHGHSDNRNNTYVGVNAAPFLRLTDGEEHTVDSTIYQRGSLRVAFVLVDKTKTSETVTEILYGADSTSSSNEIYLQNAFINQAKDAIYLHGDLYGDNISLDLNSVPAASAFTLTDNSGASAGTINSVELHQEDLQENNYQRHFYVKLGVTLADPESFGDYVYRVRYTKPDTNPLQDTSVPHAEVEGADNLWVSEAAVTLSPDDIHTSSDGKYLFFQTEHSFYLPNSDGTGYTVAVSQNGQALSYQVVETDADAWNLYAYMENASAAVSPASEMTVTVTPATGVTDYAMDPVTAVTNAGTSASEPFKLQSAVYNSANKILRVTTVGGNISNYRSSPACCSFQLKSPDGTVFALRRTGGTTSYYDQTLGERVQVFQIEAGNLPAVPEATGWKLVYNPLHADLDSNWLAKAMSGEPLSAPQEVAITIQ